MKRVLTSILLFYALSLNAQTMPPAAGVEPYRQHIRPYATEYEAFARTDAETRYIVPLGDWTREESGDEVRFSTEFVYPAAWLNRQILVRVESASTGYAVEVGGRRAGYTRNGSDPVEFNITKLSKQGINTISVVLTPSAENSALSKDGVAWIGRTEILSQPTIRLRDIDCRTTLDENGDGILEVAMAVKTDALNPKTARIQYELIAPDTTQLAFGYRDVKIEMRGEDTVRFMAKVPRQWLWSVESPSLLDLSVRNRIEGRYAENIVVQIGAREVRYADDKLAVNGEIQSLKVRKVQSNITLEEIGELKSGGYNAVTTEAGDSSTGLYDVCDRAGIYLIPQLAVDTSDGGRSIRRGGNPSNDPALTPDYAERAAAMYHSSKIHPSVIAFSLGHGITNGINPYETYLQLKRLDGNRPVIYEGAGKEWNNDRFDLRIVKPLE